MKQAVLGFAFLSSLVSLPAFAFSQYADGSPLLGAKHQCWYIDEPVNGRFVEGRAIDTNAPGPMNALSECLAFMRDNAPMTPNKVLVEHIKK